MVIKPDAIPHFTGNVDAIETQAGTLGTVGAEFRDIGADVHTTWQGLSAFYAAPEAGRLFAATAPIRTAADTFGGQVEQVGSTLRQYAATIRPIVERLERLRGEAASFVAMTEADEDWREDEQNVNRNNDLIRQVDTQVAALMAAERTAANQINGLYGGTQWVADDGSGRADAYGFQAGDIPADAERPWGVAEEVDEPWYADTWNAVWSGTKGVVVDGLWGTVTGVVGLVNPFDWDTFSSSWAGIWTLTGNVFVNPGETGDAWVALGKGLLAWDEWEKDPARATGAVLFNVLTLPVAWLKVGRAGQAGRVGLLDEAGNAARLNRLAELADAGRLTGLLRLNKIELPTVGDLARQIDATFDEVLARDPGLDAALRNADDLVAKADPPAMNSADGGNPPGAREPELVGAGGREIDGGGHGPTGGSADHAGGGGGPGDGPVSPGAGPPHDPGSPGSPGAPRDQPSPGAPADSYRTPDRGSPEYDARRTELAQDPAHGGQVKAKGLREAEVGLDMERRGELPGPIRRAPLETDAQGRTVDTGEFIDANDTHWDVKAPADIFPAGRQAGQPMPPGLRGRYDGEDVMDDIADELDKGQNVIIDSRHLSEASLADLRQRVAARPEWQDRVRFH